MFDGAEEALEGHFGSPDPLHLDALGSDGGRLGGDFFAN